MIHYPHFKAAMVKTLKDMKADSPQARMAITMLTAHESDYGKYWQQLNGGPALGIIQMEPPTHESTWLWCDSIQRRAGYAGIIQNVDSLRESIRYNVFMARCRLLMKPQAFPDDAVSMSVYLKRHWNTTKGKATPDDYLDAYYEWVEPWE